MLIAFAAGAGLASCSDGGPAEPDVQQRRPPPPGLAVSEPVAASGGAGALAGAADGTVYTSASPSTFPDGVEASITNLATGESVVVEIEDGGFDPVALMGSPGDELEIGVRNRDGSITVFRTTVPTRKRPRVVRTQPPKDATDVVVRSSVVVVFSEPVRESTITLETVKLLLDGQPVQGTLTLRDDGIQAKFTPAQALAPEITYTLVVTTGVRDVAGDSLEAQVEVSFTTGAPQQESLSGVNPAWSPDGSKLAFVSLGDIATMNAGGTGKIAFVSDRDGGEFHIYIMNANGTGVVSLPDSGVVRLAEHPALDAHPTWSPDGSRIAFESNRHSTYDNPQGCLTSNCDYDIYVINADGTDLVRLTSSERWDAFPAWSPDGSKIAFSSLRDGNWEIYTINPDGTGLARLTNDPGLQRFPAWSPDGSKIAFEHSISESFPSDIYVINADGTGMARVTTHAGPDTHPAWSPDGSRIAFTSVRETDGGFGDIYAINADGTTPVRLTVHGAWDFDPTWRR